MTSQERFTVFVKALGVWILATGLGTLPIATFQLREFSNPQDLFYMILGSIAEPMLMCLGGFWLIRSNWISRIAYSSVKVPGQAVSDVSDSVATLELFSAILKTLGVWFLFQGITRIPFGLNWLHSAKIPTAFLVYRVQLLVTPAIPVACGGLLLIATNWFIRLGFPELVVSDDIEQTENKSKSCDEVLFSVIVKALGVYFMVNGLTKLPYAISQASVAGSSDPKSMKTYAEIFEAPVMAIVVGTLVFFATDLFVSLGFAKVWQRNQNTDNGEDFSSE